MHLRRGSRRLWRGRSRRRRAPVRLSWSRTPHGASGSARTAVSRRPEARAGVRLVLPLGLAFLPAFACTTVIPIVLALGQRVLGTEGGSRGGGAVPPPARVSGLSTVHAPCATSSTGAPGDHGRFSRSHVDWVSGGEGPPPEEVAECVSDCR